MRAPASGSYLNGAFNRLKKIKLIVLVDGKNLKLNKLFGNPQLNVFVDPNCQTECEEYRASEIDIEC